MARRIRLEPEPPGYASPPDEAINATVEDLVPAVERARHSFDGRCPVCRAETALLGDTNCAEHIESSAAHRYRRARRAWLDEHRVPREDQCRVWPRHRPQLERTT